MHTTDFVVHIDETLNQTALESIEDGIRHSPGVISAGHSPERPHLVQVIYDTEATRMVNIVQEVRQHGLHAQAVAL
jgi:hypothetical protein